MKNNQNRILIAFIIVAVLFGGVYYVGQQEVKDAVEQLEMDISDFSIDSLSVIPPEAEITLTYTVFNPSDTRLEIAIDGLVYYGDIVITPVIVEEQMIPANGSETIGAQITLNSTLLESIGNPENQGNYSLNGTLTATGQYMGVLPVTVKLKLSELKTP